MNTEEIIRELNDLWYEIIEGKIIDRDKKLDALHYALEILESLRDRV